MLHISGDSFHSTSDFLDILDQMYNMLYKYQGRGKELDTNQACQNHQLQQRIENIASSVTASRKIYRLDIFLYIH